MAAPTHIRVSPRTYNLIAEYRKALVDWAKANGMAGPEGLFADTTADQLVANAVNTAITQVKAVTPSECIPVPEPINLMDLVKNAK